MFFFVELKLKIIKEIIDEKYIESVVKKIDDSRTFPTSYYGKASGKIESGTGNLFVEGNLITQYLLIDPKLYIVN